MDHRICFQCKLINKIPDCEVFSIHDLLYSKEANFSHINILIDAKELQDLKKLEIEYESISSQIRNS